MSMLHPQVAETALKAGSSMINGGENGELAGVKGKRTITGVFSAAPGTSSFESASPSPSIGAKSECEFFVLQLWALLCV